MLIEQGTVISVDGSSVLVSMSVRRTCSQCQSNNGCGMHLFAGMIGQRQPHIKLENMIAANVGDQVQVGIPNKSLIRLAFISYFIPILIMLGSAFLLQVFWDGIDEILLILLSIGSFIIGILLTGKIIQGRVSDISLHPRLLCIDKVNLNS